ncbi:MAG: ribonuclease P protein component [Bacilli bacterium]|nr:ribonuclease P protein component [Bacilli bacterium]
MKREYRVKKHPEFDHIIRSGRKMKSEHFALYFEQIPGQNHSRIGIAVGKKNGVAVTRVRIKRQVRAMLAKRNDYDQPINLIIVVRPNYHVDEFAANEEELNASLDAMKEQLN